MHSAVVKSCHAHTRFIKSVPLQWFRMACKYAHKVMIFYELTNIAKNALLLSFIWRYLVKILNRICMKSCGGGCRGQLPDSVHLSTSSCVFLPLLSFQGTCLCFNGISHWFVMLPSDWLLWVAGFWSNDTREENFLCMQPRNSSESTAVLGRLLALQSLIVLPVILRWSWLEYSRV